MRLFPWSGFLYELRRALLSIPLIVLTVIIVLASFGILAIIAESRPAPTNFLQATGAYYFTGGGYHFEFYAYDAYGHPVSGANISLMVYQSNLTFGPPGAPLATVSGLTMGTGLVQVLVPLNGPNYTVSFSATAPGWNSAYGPGYYVPVIRPSPGAVVPFLTGFTNTVQNGQGFRASSLLQIYYLGPNGTAPPNYQVYWAAPLNASYPVTPLAEGAMHRLGSLTAVHQGFSLVVPMPSNQYWLTYLQVELFTAGGQLVATDTNQSASNFLPPPGGSAGTAVAFGFGGTVMGFLVPLMAVLAAYSVYGKDRLTGVLEGVLARPVSRLGLVTSRYLAVIAALCLAVTAAVATLDALIAWVYGGFLPLGVALALFGSLLVEIGAFTGITFLLAHTLRSTTGLVGAGLGLFAFFTIGWLFLVPILGVVTGTLSTPGYERTVVQLEFLNPTQFLSLAQDLVLGSVQGIFVFGSPTAPAAYGISYGSVIAVGLAWVLLPAALLVYVVRRWD